MVDARKPREVEVELGSLQTCDDPQNKVQR